MMLCKRATSLLTEAEEGKLEGATKVAFDLHLAICPPCRRYRAQLEKTVDMLGKLPKEEPPPSLLDALASELEKTKRET